MIEVGTSDFNTSAGTVKNGIYIEPVKYYYDRLSNDCIKENIAISNYNGFVDVYYVTPDIIKKNNAPDFLRGCSSINKKHIRLVEYINDNDILKDVVEVKRMKDIIDKYNVESIDYLKIDTEGHDLTILFDYFNTINILPKKIMFENNILTNKVELSKMITLLKNKGYLITEIPYNVVAILK